MNEISTSMQIFLFRWNISVICLAILLKLVIKAFF